MKKLHVLITMVCIMIFSVQNMQSQSDNTSKKEIYKTTKTKTPLEVKESLKDYSGYKISNEVTYTKSGKGNVYKFKVQKQNWSHYLLIDEKGKIIGIETGEHSGNI